MIDEQHVTSLDVVVDDQHVVSLDVRLVDLQMCVGGNVKAQGVDDPTNNDVIHLTLSTFVGNFTKLMKPTQFIQMMAKLYKRKNSFHLNLYIKLFLKLPKLKVFTLSWAKTQGTIKKLR